MKKLFALLLAIILISCITDKKDSPADNQRFTMICRQISSVASDVWAAENGWYELFRYTDGTADILFTDLSTGVRKPLQNEKIITPYGVMNGMFIADNKIYHYSYCYPESLNIEYRPGILYQYSTNGTLLKSVEMEESVLLCMDSAVISDDEFIYLVGEDIKYDRKNLCLFSIDTKNLAIKKVYEFDKNVLNLKGCYENSLIFTSVRQLDEGSKVFPILLLDMDTLELSTLCEAETTLEMLNNTKLYQHKNQNTNLVYDIKKQQYSTLTFFDNANEIKILSVSHTAEADGKLIIKTQQGDLLKDYVYDYYSGKLAPVKWYYHDMPYYLNNGQTGYFLVPTSKEKHPLPGLPVNTNDRTFAIITAEDYYNGVDNPVYVKNEIDYR